MRLRFTDGVEFETDGPFRVERRFDGYYVVGNGELHPVDSWDEAVAILNEYWDQHETTEDQNDSSHH